MICDDCSTSFNPDVEGSIYHGKSVIALCTSCCDSMEKEISPKLKSEAKA